MANTNIKLFDENKSNMMSDIDYGKDTQRANGVQTGLASSRLQNKFQYQMSLMAYAVAQLMIANGYDAMDSAAVSTFVGNFSNSVVQKVKDKASASEAAAGTNDLKWISAKQLVDVATTIANKAATGVVKYNTPQTLTDAQKQQARDNINAPAPYEAGDNIAITGRVITTKAFPCNPNLLENWYFGNPVNQRGQTSYTVAGYTIDRWKLDIGESVTIDKGLTLTKAHTYIGQYFDDFDKFIGRQLTGSVLTSDGDLCTGTFVYNGVLNQGQTFFGNSRLSMYINSVSAGLTQVELNTISDNVKVLAVKLELGSQQTLAHQENGVWVLNEIPNYADELAKCQFYYEEGVVRAAVYENTYYIITRFISRKRTIPSITIYSGNDAIDKVSYYNDEQMVDVDASVVQDWINVDEFAVDARKAMNNVQRTLVFKYKASADL